MLAISVNDEDRLSTQIVSLGDRMMEIFAALDEAGYAEPVATYQQVLNEFADSTVARDALNDYWKEYAKERLSALRGPLDILSGKYLRNSSYRSDLLSVLRKMAPSLPSSSIIPTREIEPTLKKFMEIDPSSEFAPRFRRKVAEARGAAAARYADQCHFDLDDLGRDKRQEIMVSRLECKLILCQFNLIRHRKDGVVFTRILRNKKWSFSLVDDSYGTLDNGRFYQRFCINSSSGIIKPKAAGMNAMANFAPEIIIPGFVYATSFRNCCEFYLAVDTICVVANIVAEVLDEILVEA